MCLFHVKQGGSTKKEEKFLLLRNIMSFLLSSSNWDIATYFEKSPFPPTFMVVQWIQISSNESANSFRSKQCICFIIVLR